MMLKLYDGFLTLWEWIEIVALINYGMLIELYIREKLINMYK
jgi:hypothetical protein